MGIAECNEVWSGCADKNLISSLQEKTKNTYQETFDFIAPYLIKLDKNSSIYLEMECLSDFVDHKLHPLYPLNYVFRQMEQLTIILKNYLGGDNIEVNKTDRGALVLAFASDSQSSSVLNLLSDVGFINAVALPSRAIFCELESLSP